MQGDGNIDLAIFKISRNAKLEHSVVGYSLEDFADEATMEKVSVGEDIVMWGYPNGYIILKNQIVEPQQKEAKVTATPSSSSDVLQTDLQSNFGGSGSFILSKKTGKIIGILNEVDPLNPSNINSVPASSMRRLLKDIVNNSTIKTKKNENK